MSLVDYSVNNRIGFVTLNRPEKRNALSKELVADLMVALSKAEHDSDAKVIVLKANGDAFCAGADLAYLQQLQKFSHEENLKDSNQLKELFLKIYTLRKVVIAQVQGHALAGGCGLANVCDFVFAVPEAKFGYTEVKIGFVPALVSVFLIRKIGEQKAKQLLLTGDLISGQETIRMGLVNYLVEKNELETSVITFAQRMIKNNSAQSLELTKKLITDVQSMELEDALDHAAEINAEARGTDDCKKGIDAFLNKKDLSW
ncbi:MAG TPA: enoyl-CoA hydratase/isomerase family protein [Cyclobacteriaceae bacterium]|nr:enoyl-CoA hydratase/isomerase family protein [Cyclobacteriaceae bacterium]